MKDHVLWMMQFDLNQVVYLWFLSWVPLQSARSIDFCWDICDSWKFFHHTYNIALCLSFIAFKQGTFTYLLDSFVVGIKVEFCVLVKVELIKVSTSCRNAVLGRCTRVCKFVFVNVFLFK